MSRSTQYIGLNAYARKLVEGATRTETYEMTTGMFDEPITGTIYHMPPPYPDVNAEWILKEVVQVVPWSGGPMIFTMLESTIIKKVKDSDPIVEHYCQWAVDPSLKESHVEYDDETGRYYI